MIYYNLFLRNWLNHRANEPEIDLAVTKGLLTEEQGEEIKNTTR